MTLETIYYIGQTIAVVAILGSLIAIFLQQRQANKISRVENSQSLSLVYADSLRDIMNSAELAAIFRKVMFEDAPLDRVEATRILFYFNVMIDSNVKAWVAKQSGLYDAAAMKPMTANTAWYLTKPIFRKEWKRLEALGFYPDGFADHINSLIKPAGSDDQQAQISGSSAPMASKHNPDEEFES
ncbi:MAG: hypothetical protein AAFR90_14175 [Pseudomonadota bacterium]